MKFLESLYIKAFINIVVHRNETVVFVETFTKDKLLDSYEESFETTSVNEKLVAYIHNFTKQTPFYYISYLDNSTSQGAIPTCVKNEISLYHDVSACEYKCQDKQWTYYTAKTDLYEIEKTYEKIGLDFIFSPFTLVSQFFKDKINEHFAGYILIQEHLITVTVFENTALLYGETLIIDEYEADETLEDAMIEDVDIVDEIEEGIDLDDISTIDELESLDDFGDIEDLDSFEEMDDFAQSEDVEEEFHEEVEAIENDEPEESISNDDYQRFTLIQNSINRYYHDEKYNSKFLETIYIADSVGVSSILKQYFEEEMFINTYVRTIDVGQELSSLSRLEVLK